MQNLIDKFKLSELKERLAPRPTGKSGGKKKMILTGGGVALMALLTAYAASLFLSGILLNRIALEKEELAALIAKRPQGMFQHGSDNKTDFSSLPNAFGVAGNRSTKGGSVATSLSAMRLVGTLPGVGAWIQSGESSTLVLQNKEFKGYLLTAVDPGRILLSKGGENFPLYLYFSTAVATATPSDLPSNTSVRGGAQIIPAEANGKEGQVSRELINALMSDPYKEIANIRMVPAEDGSGMKILRIGGESLLSQLGMQEGDILRGFNNIAIKSAQDLSNAVNSILASDRMDLEVKRQDEDVQLKYAVR